MPNVELLRQVMAKIHEEAEKPERECLWDQRNWHVEKSCGTAYCFAGWAVVLSGLKVARGHYVYDPNDDFSPWNNMDVEGAARRLLRLEHPDTDIFDGSNTLLMLDDMVENLCSGFEARDGLKGPEYYIEAETDRLRKLDKSDEEESE